MSYSTYNRKTVCFDCQDRLPGCSAKCKIRKEELAEIEKEKEVIRKKKDEINLINSMESHCHRIRVNKRTKRVGKILVTR